MKAALPEPAYPVRGNKNRTASGTNQRPYIEPLDAELLASTLVSDNSAVVFDNSKLFHQVICSPKTAMVPRQGPVGAADPW